MNSTHFFPSQKMAPPFTQLFNSKTNKSFPISLSFTPISHLRAAKNARAVPRFPCYHPSLSQRYISLGSMLYMTSQPESLCTPPLHRTCFPPLISSGIYFSTHKTWITSCPISTETPMLSKSLGVKLNHLPCPTSDLANETHVIAFSLWTTPILPHLRTFLLAAVLICDLYSQFHVSGSFLSFRSQLQGYPRRRALPDPPDHCQTYLMTLSYIILFYQFTHNPDNDPQVSCLFSWMFSVLFPYNHHRAVKSGRYRTVYVLFTILPSVSTETVRPEKASVETEQPG